MSIPGLICRLQAYIYIKQGDLFGKIIRKLTGFLLFASLIPFPFMAYFNEIYWSVFCFFSLLSFSSLSWHAADHDIALRKLRGDPRVDPSIFTKDTEIAKFNKLNYLLMVCIFFGVFFIVAASYSRNIYPFFSEQYGGGCPKEVMLSTKDGETIKGRLIHHNAASYYLLDDHDDTLIIDVATISKIKKPPCNLETVVYE